LTNNLPKIKSASIFALLKYSNMKKYFSFVLLFFCFSLLASSLYGQPRHKPHKPRPVLAAPLDGGILALLGAAGTAYFIARKKKKAE
jgi:hypothetical protein